MKDLTTPLYLVEPLASHHDRTSFYRGVVELDSYFKRQASQDVKRKVAAPFVLVHRSGGLAGYYTLSAYAIRPAALPAHIASKLPRYPLVPATLLGRLAISREYPGQKLGQLLLLDALRRSLANTREVASVVVVVDAYDDRARSFYLHHQFVSLPDHPGKLFIAMRTIGQVLV